MQKKTVAVVFGGVSSEYEVSLWSAASIIENIPRDKYETVLLGITREGAWYLYTGSTQAIKTAPGSTTSPISMPLFRPTRPKRAFGYLMRSARGALRWTVCSRFCTGPTARTAPCRGCLSFRAFRMWGATPFPAPSAWIRKSPT